MADHDPNETAGAGPAAGDAVIAAPLPPPAQYLAPAIDTATGEALGVGLGEHPIDAAMRFQARAARGSGIALANAGTSHRDQRKAGSTARSEARFEAERWIRPFVEQGLIDVIALDVEALGDTVGVFVAYRNRFTDRREEIRA